MKNYLDKLKICCEKNYITIYFNEKVGYGQYIYLNIHLYHVNIDLQKINILNEIGLNILNNIDLFVKKENEIKTNDYLFYYFYYDNLDCYYIIDYKYIYNKFISDTLIKKLSLE